MGLLTPLFTHNHWIQMFHLHEREEQAAVFQVRFLCSNNSKQTLFLGNQFVVIGQQFHCTTVFWIAKLFHCILTFNDIWHMKVKSSIIPLENNFLSENGQIVMLVKICLTIQILLLTYIVERVIHFMYRLHFQFLFLTTF